MKILQVIHGYPPYYMAGSEVYTYNLCLELAKTNTVQVFTRVENPYLVDYLITDSTENGVSIRRINKPNRDYTFRDKYLDPMVDEAFRKLMREFKPDVVHIGHLSHLSTQIPLIAKREFQCPVVFTIHDFWMQCYRGQLVDPKLHLCSGPSDSKCMSCAQHYFKEWMTPDQIQEYRSHMAKIIQHIDLFLSPSRTLEKFYQQEGVPSDKIIFSPYGFDTTRIHPRQAFRKEGPLRVGFLGRIIPVKGIDLLIRAFRKTKGDAELQIWGNAGSHRTWLNEYAQGDSRILFKGAYHNDNIQYVLDGMDILVVPSIWLENAPLVIQEAQLAHLPVITSDAGGMSELVQHGINGYLFPLGDEVALTKQLQKLIQIPESLQSLQTSIHTVRSIEDDAQFCVQQYHKVMAMHSQKSPLSHRPSPWRVTFVTNPDQCNMQCAMCDTHSIYAPKTSKKIRELDIGIIERTIRDLAQRGLREIIPSTMGEPLLYGHFDKMIELASKFKVKINLTTNGTFPRGGVHTWAPKLLPVVSDVKISINSLDPTINQKIMTGIQNFPQLDNIKAYLGHRDEFRKQGYHSTLTLQVTFHRSNLDKLLALIQWAMENGVDRVKGHHLWVTWPQLKSESLRQDREGALLWNQRLQEIHSMVETHPAKPSHFRLDNFLPLDLNHPEQLPDNYICPFLGQEAWIEADGSFQICCCPADKRKDFGDFGNASANSFIELWESERYTNNFKQWGKHPNCQVCNMRRPA